MTVTLIFLAGLMAAVLWWLFRQSYDMQPWVAQPGARDVHGSVLERPAAKTALVVFLAAITSLFALFISAYAMRMHFGDWTPLPDPPLLAFNSVLLVATSVAMQWTVRAVRRGATGAVRTGLITSGALTVAFLVAQLVVWRQLAAAGYYLQSNPANAFFFLLTAVHGVHVLGGMVAWGRTFARLAQRPPPPASLLRLPVELCAIYWHFLLAVWIVLYALLLAT